MHVQGDGECFGSAAEVDAGFAEIVGAAPGHRFGNDVFGSADVGKTRDSFR